MLSGFNTNVRHKGVLFHVQTEDSGRDHPHVITHLFHGGNILASEKQSYAHLLGEDEALEPQVKRLMDEQHGAMLDQLRSGVHDRVIRERLGSGAASAAPPPASSTDRTEPPRAPSALPPRRPSAPPTSHAPSKKPAPRASDARGPRPAAKPTSPAPSGPVASDPSAAAGERQRPLDEVVLDYLLESARQRTKR